MCALPILDPAQELPDFKGSFAIFRAGDVAKFRLIGREEFDELRAKVEEKTARYRIAEVEFRPSSFFADPDGYTAELVARLDA